MIEKNMRYYLFFIFFFIKHDSKDISLVCDESLSNQKKRDYIIQPRDNSDYYELLLFNFLYDHINIEHLSQANIGAIVSKKSQYWNLYESVVVFLYSMSIKKYKKYRVFALERLYSLSNDAKMSELILWNLANEYERYDKLKGACELYGQFKKIFPGSEFYWSARYREIKVAYQLAMDDYLDISYNDMIIQLIKEYIVDKAVLEEGSFNEIIVILHDLSFKMIKKHIHIVQHYIQKYSYTYDIHTILSSWQRLNTIINDIDFFLDICSFEEDSFKKNKLYYSVLTEMKSMINVFFDKHNQLLPEGQEYIIMHEKLMHYIKDKKDILLNQISFLCDKMLFAIELYYERKE